MLLSYLAHHYDANAATLAKALIAGSRALYRNMQMDSGYISAIARPEVEMQLTSISL